MFFRDMPVDSAADGENRRIDELLGKKILVAIDQWPGETSADTQYFTLLT